MPILTKESWIIYEPLGKKKLIGMQTTPNSTAIQRQNAKSTGMRPSGM